MESRRLWMQSHFRLLQDEEAQHIFASLHHDALVCSYTWPFMSLLNCADHPSIAYTCKDFWTIPGTIWRT